MTLDKDIMPFFDGAAPNSWLVKAYEINHSLPLLALKHLPLLPY